MAAVQAGYRVTAIDAFADRQTVEIAHTTIAVAYDDRGFNAEALMRVITQLDASQYLGFVYGSGFEAQPNLLEKIANIIPLIGNTSASVKAVKTAASFFGALTLKNIPYPKTYQQLTLGLPVGYLQKFAGGCGGTHINILRNQNTPPAVNCYYQQYIDGRSVSLLFFADAHNIAPIGFNEQWLSATTTMPFRYGGAVSYIKLSLTQQQQMIDAALILTQQFSLRGFNSLDAIVRDDIVYVLEINPRLSASFDLYETDLAEMSLMDLHIQACLEGKALLSMEIKKSGPVKVKSKAHVVIYALEDLVIPATFVWPHWVLDCPYSQGESGDIKLLADQPICSVVAEADDANTAKQIVNARVKIINNLLGIGLKSEEYVTL